MIRKSVETRDWLNTIEPRNVRAVMKRIVEDVTAIDTQVGQLYEEGVRKAHSSGLSTELFAFPPTVYLGKSNTRRLRFLSQSEMSEYTSTPENWKIVTAVWHNKNTSCY